MKRPSISIPYEAYDAINTVPSEQQDILICATVRYIAENIEPSFEGLLQLAWETIRQKCDLSYIRSLAGRKGGAPVGNNNASKQAKTTKTSKNNQNTEEENKQKQPKTSKNNQNKQKQPNDITKENTLKINELANETGADHLNNSLLCSDSTKESSKENNIYIYNKQVDNRGVGEEEKKDDTSKNKAKQTKTKTIEVRKKEFIESMKPYLDKYGKEMLNDFFRYWAEPNQANTKMRWEMEKTWNLTMRLSRWSKMQPTFQKSSSY